ncbi:hypothetical protein CY35_14G009300 [Sphagnum magellanicum]|nr:hypothetical protein CY35_14G009300 [Sphagnum magellanicum]
MEVLARRAASSTAAAAVMRRQEGVSCNYNGCNRSSQKSDASCALSRVRVCGASSLSWCCSKLGGSKVFDRQSSGDNFREGCIIKKSVIRKKKTCFRRSSRPSATTLHASLGVARRHEDSTNRGATSYLDRLENRSGIRTGMQLDCWVEDAVFEIVKNVDQAPFLQFVFETNNSSSKRSKQQQVSQEVFEKPECWLQLRDSLSRVSAPPDGVIFVQRLDVTSCCLEEEEEEEEDPAAAAAFGNDRRWKCPLELNGSCTNMWGVVVQARSARASACYILKTTKVCSSAGLCTQFCLTRAKCFGPSIAAQLERVWLL